MLSYYERNKKTILKKLEEKRRANGVKEKYTIKREVVKHIEFIPKQSLITFD
jgi:hypothetical protein